MLEMIQEKGPDGSDCVWMVGPPGLALVPEAALRKKVADAGIAESDEDAVMSYLATNGWRFAGLEEVTKGHVIVKVEKVTE
jgi:hypothetical protein